MNLKFSWTSHGGTASPACEPDAADLRGFSPLSCLLSDDGGQPYPLTLPWLEEGLRRVAQSRQHPEEALNWSRDAWAADLCGDTVKIYSLLGDGLCECVCLNSFERALLAWRDFLSNGPDGVSRPMVTAIHE